MSRATESVRLSLVALTHQVLGQLKASVVVLGGWLLFEQGYPAKSLLGAALAAGAILAYTSINIRERGTRVTGNPPPGSSCGSRPRLPPGIGMLGSGLLYTPFVGVGRARLCRALGERLRCDRLCQPG